MRRFTSHLKFYSKTKISSKIALRDWLQLSCIGCSSKFYPHLLEKVWRSPTDRKRPGTTKPLFHHQLKSRICGPGCRWRCGRRRKRSRRLTPPRSWSRTTTLSWSDFSRYTLPTRLGFISYSQFSGYSLGKNTTIFTRLLWLLRRTRDHLSTSWSLCIQRCCFYGISNFVWHESIRRCKSYYRWNTQACNRR